MACWHRRLLHFTIPVLGPLCGSRCLIHGSFLIVLDTRFSSGFQPFGERGHPVRVFRIMPIHQAEPALLCGRCSQRLFAIRTGPCLFPGLPLVLDPDFCPEQEAPSFDLVSDPLMSATSRITRQQVSIEAIGVLIPWVCTKPCIGADAETVVTLTIQERKYLISV